MSDEDVERLAHEAMQLGDLDFAVRLLEPLAETNSVYALEALGWIYQYGAGKFDNKKLASGYYRRAISLGSIKTRADLGLLLIAQRKFDEARNILQCNKLDNDSAIAEVINFLDDAEDEYFASEAIEGGQYNKAFDLLEPRKKGNSEYTLLALGWLYETGRAGPIDSDQARSLYQRAVDSGSAEANFKLGTLELALGNDELARAAFQTGAELGHLPAMTKLGEFMVEGKGGDMNAEKGLKFLMEAAQQGHIMAKIKLADVRYKNENNFFKRIILKIRSYAIIKDAIVESIRRPRSERMYEFH